MKAAIPVFFLVAYDGRFGLVKSFQILSQRFAHSIIEFKQIFFINFRFLVVGEVADKLSHELYEGVDAVEWKGGKQTLCKIKKACTKLCTL